MRFIVASYGPKHVGMLLTHLDSIRRSHPAARVAVYWQDIPEPQITAIRATFPSFDFQQTAFDFASDYLLRISSKVQAWCRAAEEYGDEPELCFADVDTLILRDIGSFFKVEADVIFTHKPERTALNTGVLLMRGCSAATAFFREWRERTLEILRTPPLFAQANDYSLGYGAADQMALWKMLGYERDREDYEMIAGGETVRLHAAPCAQLNETNSVAVTEDKHILHYKAGWQTILLGGSPFTRNRPREQSWEMFTLYLRRFREALTRLNSTGGTRFTAADFGLVIPPYFQEETGGFDSRRYMLWQARAAGKSALHTFRRAAAKLTGGTLSAS
ncbi:MAG TPA: hypothetical protein VF593_01370 [Chthoniobacteraceae bacterium]|jgi:hypothetical protein